MSKLRISAAGRHLNTVSSPISRRPRVFLGAAQPLYDIKARCDQQFTEQLAQLQRQMGEHRRELDDQRNQSEQERERLNRKFEYMRHQKDGEIDQLSSKIDQLEGQFEQERERLNREFEYMRHQKDGEIDQLSSKIDQLESQSEQERERLNREFEYMRHYKDREIDQLRRDTSLLLRSRRSILCREIVNCVYNALGHNHEIPRATTYDYIREHQEILNQAFNFDENEITRVLRLLNPQSKKSWIKIGNEEAHGFTVDEAAELIDNNDIRMVFEALTRDVEDGSTTIHDVSLEVLGWLSKKIPEVNEIHRLPNPKTSGVATTTEIQNVMDEGINRLESTIAGYFAWSHGILEASGLIDGAGLRAGVESG
jgi:hypothetical protein